jgi:hypothetical protein
METRIPENLGKRIGSLADLPDELLAQLQFAKRSELETEIVEIINVTFDGVANVDEILVGLYRATHKIYQRPFISNKLYRMGQAGLLESIPKKKGVYRTVNP